MWLKVDQEVAKICAEKTILRQKWFEFCYFYISNVDFGLQETQQIKTSKYPEIILGHCISISGLVYEISLDFSLSSFLGQYVGYKNMAYSENSYSQNISI